MYSVDRSDKSIILFDGVCNLCNGSVQFIIKRDQSSRFLFAPLQSAVGKRLLYENNLDPDQFESIVLLEQGMVYQRSDAALRVATHLRGMHWVSVLRIIPRAIRDFVYNIIAKSRYRLFGRTDECMVPTPELRSRFLT